MASGLLHEPDTKFFSNAISLSMVISQLYREDAKRIRRTMFEYMPGIIDLIQDDESIVKYLDEEPSASAQLTYRLFSIELSLKPEFVDTYLSGELKLEKIIYSKIDEYSQDDESGEHYEVTIGVNFE